MMNETKSAATKARKPSKRDALVAEMTILCARLYSADTSADDRATLSFQVATLRTRISRSKDPLAAMMRASGNDDDSEV